MKLPAPCQLDLFADTAPPAGVLERTPPSAEVVAFPLSRHVTAREMAARMAQTPPEHRDRVWRRHTAALLRDRVASGITQDAARADLKAYTRAVRCLTAYFDGRNVEAFPH